MTGRGCGEAPTTDKPQCVGEGDNAEGRTELPMAQPNEGRAVIVRTAVRKGIAGVAVATPTVLPTGGAEGGRNGDAPAASQAASENAVESMRRRLCSNSGSDPGSQLDHHEDRLKRGEWGFSHVVHVHRCACECARAGGASLGTKDQSHRRGAVLLAPDLAGWGMRDRRGLAWRTHKASSAGKTWCNVPDT